jgi:hypothetical protein
MAKREFIGSRRSRADELWRNHLERNAKESMASGEVSAGRLWDREMARAR